MTKNLWVDPQYKIKEEIDYKKIWQNMCIFLKENDINKENFKSYIKKIKSFDLAYLLVQDCSFEKEWAKNFIETSKHAYYLVKNCGFEKEWAENIIEKDNNSLFAFLMYTDCGSDKEWAREIIGRNLESNLAYLMVEHCYSNKKWAENIIEENNDSRNACLMCLNYSSKREWAENIIEKNKNREYAHQMVIFCNSDYYEWYLNNFRGIVVYFKHDQYYLVIEKDKKESLLIVINKEKMISTKLVKESFSDFCYSLSRHRAFFEEVNHEIKNKYIGLIEKEYTVKFKVKNEFFENKSNKILNLIKLYLNGNRKVSKNIVCKTHKNHFICLNFDEVNGEIKVEVTLENDCGTMFKKVV